MRLPNMQLAQHPLEGYFYYQWNSTRRRAHIVVTLLATLLALTVFAANPLQRLFAASSAPASSLIQTGSNQTGICVQPERARRS